ncbi:MAG: tetratricopeptide repeat protein [Opitutaceae bacterium]|nr:tetratricopeptide repeat protein [Opitutaceae bacterium]
MRTGLVVVLGLIAAGIALRPLEGPAWEKIQAKQPQLRLESLKDALGQGVTVGLLGGFRAIVADLFWIRTNAVWEENDLPGTQTSIKLVTAIDPRPLYFWLNGSRMIAYDMPNWRIDKAGGYDVVPEAVKRRFDEEQSKVAVNYLNNGLDFHPDNPLLVLEIANVYLNRLKDVETAAKFYRQASEHPDAPYYAARIYAELLRRLERREEAYAFLTKLHPTLPPDNMMAQAVVVLDRIRELEDELNVPAVKRYRDPNGTPTPPPRMPGLDVDVSDLLPAPVAP